MPAAEDVIVHDFADPPLFAFPVDSIEMIDQRTEDGGIGHLTGNDPAFDLTAAEILLELLRQHLLDAADERGTLVVEDLLIVKGLYLFMLGIAPRGVP